MRLALSYPLCMVCEIARFPERHREDDGDGGMEA